MTVRALVVALAVLVGGHSASADDAPQSAVEVQHPEPAKPSRKAKWIAAGSIAAFHGTYLVWQHFAWYRKGSEDFHTDPLDTPGLGADAFAGGADKFGHAWGNYVLTRGTTAVLVAGGWPRLPSSLVSFGLTELAWSLIEIQDGMAPYGFDPKDMAANLIGGSFGVLMSNVPAVDRLLDFRLEYFPSARYRRNFYKSGDVDGAQDYTGQSYILALHLGALPRMSEYEWAYWTRFVDFAVGYEGKHYYPQPDPDPARATMYVGLSVNMQGVLTHLFDDSRGRRIGTGLFEAYSLPYTTFRFAESSSHPAMSP
jgi:hypothetical protein